MPGLDRTGPEGLGSQTGRKLGKCNPENKDTEWAEERGPWGRGRGRGGRGRGPAGRGRGRRFRGGND